MLSYLRWKLFPIKWKKTLRAVGDESVRQRLYETFFKTYTEKVWGIPCTELKAEWAAQRIKDLSLKTAILSMFFGSRQTIKTLIESFDYPRRGPGMLWNAVQPPDRSARRRRCGWIVESPKFTRRQSHHRRDRSARTERRGNDPRHAFHLEHAADGVHSQARSAAAAACAWKRLRTNALSRFPDRLPDRQSARNFFPTTGSTFTTRACAWAVSRTSRTGRRRWCRIRQEQPGAGIFLHRRR